MLSYYDTLVYIEPYVIPSEEEKTGKVDVKEKKHPMAKSNAFRIYPNPAVSYFVAEYTLHGIKTKSLTLSVCNLYGTVLQEIDLPLQSGHKVISTKVLKPGIYLCKFVINGKEKETIKLIVIK